MLYPIMCLVRGIISLRGKATEGVTATPAFGLGSRRENIISHQHFVIAQKSNWRYQIFSNEKRPECLRCWNIVIYISLVHCLSNDTVRISDYKL